MLVLVEGVVSERDWGVILSARQVDSPYQKIRVKALTKVLLGLPSPGETWSFEGELIQSPAYGLQLVAHSGFRKTPTGKLICRYLAEHAPGVGQERASRLWNRWGGDLAKIISDESNIAEIASVIAPDRPNLGVRLAAAVVRSWQESAAESTLIDWLVQRGVEDVRLSRRIAKILGDSAIEMLATNPYILVPLVSSWKKVDEFARRIIRETGAKTTNADVRRLVGAVDSVVKETLADGSTVLSQQQLEARLAKRLGAPDDSGIVQAAIAAGERNVAILRGATGWRAPGAALLEENVAAKLSRMLELSYPCPVQVPSPEELGCLLDSAATSTSALHTEQRFAVMKLMRHAVACLQGGAGTGKTYTMKALCDLYEHLGGRVLLGALAGKAAHRLSKSARRPALTLARIIAQLVEREKVESVLRNSSMDATAATKCSERLKSLTKIDQKTLVVLDEASMVDLPTLHAILRYMPEGARLLLVGCAAQLPPIGFGLIFHLLVNDPEITARLTVIHRQTTQSGIPIVSAAICERRLPPLNEYTGIAEGVSFVHCDSANLGDTVEQVAFDLGSCANGVVVVCPTKKGAGGVEALNARLHERFRNGRPELKGFNGQYYSVGDPVMWLHNDYSRGLFNGLLGQTKAISGDTADRWVEVLFDTESSVRSFELEDLMDLTLAHAITCHKIQGSQAARVVVPIYESRVLDPSWIYTAITRAEKQVVLVGSQTVLRAALMRPPATERRMVGFVWPPHHA
jgi:exodeoxyribonuclease V alpha subunit